MIDTFNSYKYTNIKLQFKIETNTNKHCKFVLSKLKHHTYNKIPESNNVVSVKIKFLFDVGISSKNGLCSVSKGPKIWIGCGKTSLFF